MYVNEARYKTTVNHMRETIKVFCLRTCTKRENEAFKRTPAKNNVMIFFFFVNSYSSYGLQPYLNYFSKY